MHRALLCLLACLALAAPLHAEQMRFGGQTRTWTAQLPAPAHGRPLVLVLHGNTQQGRDLRERSTWAGTASRHGFVALFPDGLNRAWADLRSAQERGGASPPAGTDDDAFLLALVERYVANGVADPKRIYVTGVSNGGAMALSLACRHPERFAAVASVVMEFTPTVALGCHPTRPVPVLMMNGTADPLIPYARGLFHGRREGAHYLSTPQTVAFWRKSNACTPGDAGEQRLPDSDGKDASTVVRIDSRCPPGHEVVLYRVDGGGHRMPDSIADARHPRLVDAVLGPQNHDLAAPEVIWRFFQNQRRERALR